MIQQFTHFSFFVCLCSLFVFHSTGAQAPFERYVAESSLPAEVLQAPDGTYFILTDPLAYLNRLDSEGRLINRWQLETTPASTFPYRGLGLTSSRVFAVGGEHGGTLVLHSTNYDLADRRQKTLYTGDFTGGRVAGLASNGAAVVISVLNDNGFRNPQLFLTDANLNVQTTRTYTLPGNTEVFYVGQAADGDLLLVGRDENTGNGALVRTQSDGTPRVAAPSVPAVLDGKVYGNKLYLAATNGGMTATLYVLGDNFHIDQQQDLFTHTVALSAANTRLAVGSNGTVAVATPADGKPGFDLHTFASGTFTPTGTVYHDLERGGSTVPVYGSAANNGFVFLVQTRDEARVSSDLAVVLRTNATGQGPERLAMENLSPNGLEDVDSTAFIQWADLDNDGQREALITNDKISVYRYDATAGKFERINTPFPGTREHFQSLSTADIDNDGDLDVYINRHHPNYTGVSLQPLPNILYRNNGNGTYTAEGGTICPDGMATRQSFWIDLNNDQWLDLYLSGYDHDRAYLNQGDGVTFTELDLTFLPGKHNIEDVPDGMLWDDLNGDGYIDAINQAEEEDIYILLNQHGTGFTRVPLQQHVTLFGPPFQMPHAQDFTLGYVNGKRTLVMSDFNYVRYFEHDGTRYVEKPRPLQLVFTQTNLTEFVDADNDGALDILMAGGISGHHWLNINQGDDNHTLALDAKNFSVFSWYDIDNNGTNDLLSRSSVQKNNTTGGWLKVRLRGNTSPTAGTGAVVSVNVNGVWQRRTITTHAGALGLVGDEALFGLGDATTADEVSIQWPSGCTSQYTDVAGNQLHTFEETCADTAPTVAITGSGCLGDPQTVTLGGGTAFAWYRTQAEEDAFLVSGTSVAFDTLTMTQTLYVANTSGDRASRRMPVSLSAGTRPVFNVSMSHVAAGYQFTATSTDPAVTTYQWYLNDAPVATGDTYTAPGLEAGEQWVCAGVVSNGCRARNCVEFIVTGVEASILADYTVFPNPVKGKLQVAHKGGKPFALELIHITGAQACQAGGHTSYEVDTEGYAPGLYILRINGQGAMKIIKQ